MHGAARGSKSSPIWRAQPSGRICSSNPSALRPPIRITSMARQNSRNAVRPIDLVCLPLHGRAYDFTASGTFADAVSALKPLVAFRNRTFDAIVAKYGPVGWLVESEAELFYLVSTLDRDAFMRARPQWGA